MNGLSLTESLLLQIVAVACFRIGDVRRHGHDNVAGARDVGRRALAGKGILRCHETQRLQDQVTNQREGREVLRLRRSPMIWLL